MTLGSDALSIARAGIAAVRPDAAVRRALKVHPRALTVGGTPMPLSRVAWIVTVTIALVTALLMLLEGYSGYAGVSLAVGASAAINLF